MVKYSKIITNILKINNYYFLYKIVSYIMKLNFEQIEMSFQIPQVLLDQMDQLNFI